MKTRGKWQEETAEVRDVGVFPVSEGEVTRTDEEYKKNGSKTNNTENMTWASEGETKCVLLVVWV